MNNQKLVLGILKSALLNQHLDLSTEHGNKNLIFVMREQTFLPYLYYVSQDKFFNGYYISSCLIHSQFDRVVEEVNDLLNENQIKHIFLKGTDLQHLYPDPNLRLLGDIDILVEEKDLPKATNVLKQKGAIIDSRADHHIGFTFHKLEVELHHIIIDYHSPFFNYLNDPFSNTVLIDNYNYRLEDNYNFIYIMVHFLKHLNRGAGLRSFCDLYLLLKKTNVNLKKVHSVFKKIGYERFFICVLTCLKEIFGYDDYKFTPSEHYQDLIDYSYKSGIHGYGKNNNYIENQINQNKNIFVFLLKTWFVPIKSLFSLYPWTKSIILIPFGYLARLFHLIKKRRKQFSHAIKVKKRNQELFKNIGLTNE